MSDDAVRILALLRESSGAACATRGPPDSAELPTLAPRSCRQPVRRSSPPSPRHRRSFRRRRQPRHRRDRQSVVVQSTQPDGITRDVTAEAQLHPRRPRAREGRRQRPPPRRRRRDAPSASRFDGQTVTVPVTVKDAAGRPPDQLQARRDAGLHAVRLQHRQLPRRGPRQGRLPPLALRLRPRRRLLPPHPRDRQPPHQPRRPRREPAAGEGHRRRPAHRRQAVRSRQRATTRRSSAGSKPARRNDAGRRRQAGRRSSSIPKQRRARRRRRDAADHRPGEVLRRHRPRRHQPRRLPDQQRQLGRRSRPTAWSPPATRGEAFVMARFATFTVGSQVIVLPKGLQVRLARRRRRTTTSTRWSTPSCKKLRIAPSDSATTRSSSAASTSTSSACCRRAEEYDAFMADDRPEEAREAGRRAARAQGVRRDLGDEVGRAAADPLDDNQRQLQGDAALLQLARGQIAEQRADGPDRPGAARRQRRHVQEPGDQLLPGRDATRSSWPRTSPRSSWACASSAPSATTTRSTAGRWTTTTASPRSSRRSAASRARTPARRSSSTPAAARSNHPVTGRRCRPSSSAARRPTSTGKDRREVLAKWLASPENPYFATNLANLVWAHFFGRGIIDPVDDVRVSNPPSNPELLEALGKQFTGVQVRLQAARPRHLQLAHLPAARRSRTRPTQRRARTSPTPPSAGSGPRCCSTASPGDRDQGQVPGLPLGARAVQIADGETSNYFLTTFGRATARPSARAK